MGYTWEVQAYIYEAGQGYGYQEVYVGESLWKAIKAMRNAKKNWGCVRLEWR